MALLNVADVAKLVDALDLGSSAARCESSSLSIRTKILKKAPDYSGAFLFIYLNHSAIQFGFESDIDCYSEYKENGGFNLKTTPKD